MRSVLIAPLMLGLAACNTADRAADETVNAAETTESAIANAVEEGANSFEDAVTNIAAPTDRDGWVGRWRGVEGLNLVIAKGDGPGRYTLDMQYSLDDKGTFEGTGTDAGIVFRRPDGQQVLRAGTGDETGLKWLAGKKDCLIVKDGEGYCRD